MRSNPAGANNGKDLSNDGSYQVDKLTSPVLPIFVFNEKMLVVPDNSQKVCPDGGKQASTAAGVDCGEYRGD
jgi:hypothetical protein